MNITDQLNTLNDIKARLKFNQWVVIDMRKNMTDEMFKHCMFDIARSIVNVNKLINDIITFG